ncbi:MAG: alpha/beta hydrolase [Austwickia sp.]|jgi:pimeloyl-ACP methyl ester carboxylesterase|nr:alpha/beta hydrolase [Austwickia sp.]MBK8437253.1 alpha/beta hydrolase [Austwickia sp.]MBK9102485.1 alpha/beta hydrolase [Austwickia sp.]
MQGHGSTVSAAGGDFAVIDYGGQGCDVLLVHDLTENAAVWDLVGPAVAEFAHPVAVDLRAHGQTPLGVGEDPARWWTDLGEIATGLGLRHPVVVGQGFGAWGAVAATVTGLLEPAGLVLLEGVYPWPREHVMEYLGQVLEPSLLELVAQRYGLGAVIDDSQREPFADTAAELARADWTTEQIPSSVIRAVAARSLWPLDGPGVGSSWIRRPTLEDLLALACDPLSRDPFPCLDTYLQLPTTTALVMASDGVLAQGDKDVWHLLWLRPDWTYQVVDAIRNVSAAHPDIVVKAVIDVLS